MENVDVGLFFGGWCVGVEAFGGGECRCGYFVLWILRLSGYFGWWRMWIWRCFLGNVSSEWLFFVGEGAVDVGILGFGGGNVEDGIGCGS